MQGSALMRARHVEGRGRSAPLNFGSLDLVFLEAALAADLIMARSRAHQSTLLHSQNCLRSAGKAWNPISRVVSVSLSNNDVEEVLEGVVRVLIASNQTTCCDERVAGIVDTRVFTSFCKA